MEISEGIKYYSSVYPNGIELVTAENRQHAVHFADEGPLFPLEDGESPSVGIAYVLYSVAAEQLKLARPAPGDSILVISDSGPEGAATLLAALAYDAKLFYLGADPVSESFARELGAEVYGTLQEMQDCIKESTAGEGPNIIIDLSAYQGIVSLLVNGIISQAGRLVIGRRDKAPDSYQMRMGSYKEINIFGCDRCTGLVSLSDAEKQRLCRIADDYIKVTDREA